MRSVGVSRLVQVSRDWFPAARALEAAARFATLSLPGAPPRGKDGATPPPPPTEAELTAPICVALARVDKLLDEVVSQLMARS